jgi:hypothetical protein
MHCMCAAECVVMPPVNECYVDVCVCVCVGASECESECAYPFLLCNPRLICYIIRGGSLARPLFNFPWPFRTHCKLMGENFISSKLTPGLDWSLILSLSPSAGPVGIIVDVITSLYDTFTPQRQVLIENMERERLKSASKPLQYTNWKRRSFRASIEKNSVLCTYELALAAGFVMRKHKNKIPLLKCDWSVLE